MFCSNCGKATNEQDKFCASCGHAISSTGSPPSASVSGEAPTPSSESTSLQDANGAAPRLDDKIRLHNAHRAHNAKNWDEAQASYEEILNSTDDPKVKNKAQVALSLIAAKKRPDGTLGYWSLVLLALIPIGAFGIAWVLDLASLPIAGLVMSLMPLGFIVAFICAVVALLAQRGTWNKLAGLVTLGVVAWFAYSVGEMGITKNERFVIYEGISTASAARTAVSEFYLSEGRLPSSNAEAGVAEPQAFASPQVDSLTITAGGVITITYKIGKFAGKTIVYQPYTSADGSVYWDCTGGTVLLRARPANCREPVDLSAITDTATSPEIAQSTSPPATQHNKVQATVAPADVVRRALESSDYATALAPATTLAEQGDAYMQYLVGWIHVYGKGGQDADTKSGIAWLQKAADQGEIEAQYTIAQLYNQGVGVTKDPKRYFDIVLDLAHIGDARSANEAGYAYNIGNGTPKDLGEAFYWYEKAANQNHVIGMRNLGICYQYGEGTKKNLDKAKMWYQKAADLGDEEAKKLLGAL